MWNDVLAIAPTTYRWTGHANDSGKIHPLDSRDIIYRLITIFKGRSSVEVSESDLGNGRWRIFQLETNADNPTKKALQVRKI